MNVLQVLRKSAWKFALGAAGFCSSMVCVMGYYPVIPAYFTATYLMGGAGVFLYVGMLAGMGCYLPLSSMVKYTVALMVIAVGIRFYIWANRRCSCMTAGLIAGGILTVLNLSGHIVSMDSGTTLILGLSEGIMIMGITIAVYYVLAMLPQLMHDLAFAAKRDEPAPEMPAARHEEKAAAFATAVDGLAAAFSSMQRSKEKTVAEDVGLLEQEITGKLCAACDGCTVCWEEHRLDLSVRIRQMLNAVVARHPREDIVESRYVSACPRYPSMVEEAIAAFERIELNQAWYRRLLENRMAIAGQLDAIAGLMNEWSKADRNLDSSNRMLLTKIAFEAKEKGLLAEDIHIYGDAENRKYIRALVSAKWSGGIPSRNYVRALEKAMGQSLRAEQGTKSILTKDPVWITVYEDTRFYTMEGIAGKKKTGSSVSGDSFASFAMENGRHYLCLSDGMGSGSRAARESGLVVDLLQKFVEAGFREEMAIRMMNSAMVLQDEDHSYSTLDLAAINLYDGSLELYKIGAASSFLRTKDKTEFIASDSLPAGADLDLAPEIVQRSLKNGDFLVMVSDGVLEYLHVKNPEEKFAEILDEIQTDNASVLAQKALDRVLMFTGGYVPDDMTILVTGVWEK
jgi:stage II sporulation protein E